jgi:energy-coupling factor transport system ATP-binding protein
VRRASAGYLSQDPGRYLVRERALDEVALAVGDRERARRALELVGLGPLADRHPRDLSSGERERLGFAAVAVAEPELLVLDEPTRGIDPERKEAIAQWLFAYAAGGRGALVATHDRSFPADRRITLTGA